MLRIRRQKKQKGEVGIRTFFSGCSGVIILPPTTIPPNRPRLHVLLSARQDMVNLTSQRIQQLKRRNLNHFSSLHHQRSKCQLASPSFQFLLRSGFATPCKNTTLAKWLRLPAKHLFNPPIRFATRLSAFENSDNKFAVLHSKRSIVIVNKESLPTAVAETPTHLKILASLIVK